MRIFLKWRLLPFLLIPVCISFGCSGNLPDEKKAMEVAQNSYAVTADKPVYRFIEDFLVQKGDEVKPGRWDVEKFADNKYLVSYKYQLYSFNEGVGEKGFFFEVDLDTESVIDRTNEYLKRMKPLSNAYTNEKEIFKEIIKEDDTMENLK